MGGNKPPKTHPPLIHPFVAEPYFATRLLTAHYDAEAVITATTQRAKSARRLRILRLPAVCDRTGLSRATVYRRLGHLKIELGPHSAGWLESDIDDWIDERIAASRGEATTAK